MSYANINNPANYQLASFGQFGFRKIPAGNYGVADEQYRVIYALEDSSVTVVASSGDNLGAEFLLAGTAIYGLFTVVYVDGGSVLAYIA